MFLKICLDPFLWLLLFLKKTIKALHSHYFISCMTYWNNMFMGLFVVRVILSSLWPYLPPTVDFCLLSELFIFKFRFIFGCFFLIYDFKNSHCYVSSIFDLSTQLLSVIYLSVYLQDENTLKDVAEKKS